MEKKYTLKQDSQSILNIIESLQFYRDNAIKPKFDYVINNQLSDIGSQLNTQGINIVINVGEPKFKFGTRAIFEDKKAIIIGMSDEDYFVKIACINENDFQILDVPVNLLNITKD